MSCPEHDVVGVAAELPENGGEMTPREAQAHSELIRAHRIIAGLVLAVVVLLIILVINLAGSNASADEAPATQQAETAETPASEIDWQAPTGTQPDLSTMTELRVDVRLGDQRVDVKNGDDVIYTMVASSGLDNSTPTGDFTIGQRGEDFFNGDEGMGANWWTAFEGTTYLFHSVPTDTEGNYIESEALKLGEPASHGCVRLTVADAKWFYDAIPTDTPVHIA